MVVMASFRDGHFDDRLPRAVSGLETAFKQAPLGATMVPKYADAQKVANLAEEVSNIRVELGACKRHVNSMKKCTHVVLENF